LTFTADAQAVFDLYQQGKQIFADLLTVPGTLWSINIQPINKGMIEATVDGDSPSGLVGPSKNLFRESIPFNEVYPVLNHDHDLVLLEHVQWTNASIDAEITARSNQFLTFAQNLGSQRGLLNSK
jgi:hypothetical protein